MYPPIKVERYAIGNIKSNIDVEIKLDNTKIQETCEKYTQGKKGQPNGQLKLSSWIGNFYINSDAGLGWCVIPKVNETQYKSKIWEE